MTDRLPTPSPLDYARPGPKRNRWRGWVWAHVAASYVSVAASAVAHLAVGSGGGFSIGPGAAGQVLLAVAACPLWVPVVLIVAPVTAAAEGTMPFPAFFVMAGTYATALVLIRVVMDRRDAALVQ